MNAPRSFGELDPITFEVIRHRLWAINDDQATMAARLSGSPIVYDAYDFNAALVTAAGSGLYTGVYIMHHGATIDEFVRRVLADWDTVSPGDMFFTNDPWWGALHANDGILVMPIFHGDRLVFWSGIVMHDNDVGSRIPGSWVTGAKDRFDEAPLLPAVKIAEGFQVRPDIERLYLRNSRTAELNALNMRARVAALRSTHERILALIDQYGLDTVLAAQQGILDYVEEAVRGRLAEIPDGSWYSESYHDHDGNTDATYRFCCRAIKRGETLTFDMTGTSGQAAGPINCARPAMEAAVFGVVLSRLCQDLPWSIGGIRRVLEIRSEPGTINNADGDAATSMASVAATLSTQDAVADAVGKMLVCSDQHRHDAQASWSPGVCTGSFAAMNGDGVYAVTPLGNSFGGGGGARSFQDGIDTGGVMHSMASRIPNVETLESRTPILQLFRRELRDGGGVGRFRGGVGLEFACIPHKLIGEAVLNTIAAGVKMPVGHGLAGGSPGAAVYNVVLREADVRELFARGVLPVAAAEIQARQADVQEPKQLTTMGEADVLFGVVGSGSGYGDPVRREADAVARDVRHGLVSAAAARAAYGVVLADGGVDAAATADARAEILARRLALSRPAEGTSGAARKVDGEEILHRVGDTIEAVDAGDAVLLRCSVCRAALGDQRRGFRRSTPSLDLELAALNPGNRHCDAAFVARRHVCPGCGTSLAVDVVERAAAITEDLALGPVAP